MVSPYMGEGNKKLAVYFFTFFLLLLAFVSFLVIRPFLLPIVGSFIIAFLFYPLYRSILGWIKLENTSAFIVSLVFVLIITIPLFLLISAVSREVATSYNDFTNHLTQEGKVLGYDCTRTNSVCELYNTLNTNERFKFYVTASISNIASVF